jgi:hypothetical protein
MLEAGLRATFRHFWTLFFLAAAVTVPLHLIYVFAFHNVIALRDLAPQIQHFPASRQVHLVGPIQLDHARIALWVLDAAEILLLVLAVRAADAVIATDERGEVPTAVKAWRHSLSRGGGGKLRLGPAWVGAAVTALLVGGLLDAITRLIAEPIPTNWSFVVLGLGQGAARAAGAAFFLGTAGASTRVTTTGHVVRDHPI